MSTTHLTTAPLPTRKTPSPSPTVTRRPSPPPPSQPRPASERAHRAERLKAAVEYPLAAALFAAALPVMLLTLLAVKLTSRGPALYTQTRVGRGGKPFTIYKVRSMYHECESLTGPRWWVPGDPRVTPLGHVLRTLHLDELPQLWNVLRGDMALVGPRPERPEICKNLRRVIPGYDARHAVKPGITGFAQIHLPPDSGLQSVRNKVAYDRFYILRMGAAADLYIYACTALKIVGLKRLYHRAPRKPADE